MVDVYVLGDGLPELAAALEFAEVGLSVRIGVPEREGVSGREGVSERVGDPEREGVPWFEARSDAWGGLEGRGVPDPEGALRGLLEHVSSALADGGSTTAAARPVAEPPTVVLLRGAKDEWLPQPTPAVLGIPAVPVSSSAIALLGGGAAARAYLDRVKPVLTIGKTHALGALVRARLGRVALERLVEPLVRERFGVSADEVDVAIAAPGLNEALTRAGSLSGAVLAYSERDVARETVVAPSGGWVELRRALLERLALYGAELSEAPVAAVRRGDDAIGGWVVAESDGDVAARSLVIGVEGARPVWPAELDETLGGLRPTHQRISGSAEIEDPGLPEDQGDTPAVQTVTVSGGEPWSVRIERDGAGYRATATGPAIPSSGSDAAAIPSEADARVREALAAAGARLRAGAAPGVAVRVAAFASSEQRDAAINRLDGVRGTHRDVLPVGSALHGGDLARAVADARAEAVTLRRRLTGIAE